mgnify:CR=1 FL=1
MAGGERYSLFIAWAKVLLPVAALALLSTLFLFSTRREAPVEMPFSDRGIEELSQGERMGRPRYSGMTGDGASLSFTAASVAPADGGARVAADRMNATIETARGGRFELAAEEGALDPETRRAEMWGGVTMRTDGGYVVVTDAMTARLDRTLVESAGAVRADGPPGTLTAGRFTLTHEGDGDDGYVLVFKDGVKLVYDPEK